MAKRKTEFENSLFKNQQRYVYYYNRLKELAMSMFEWKNLPDTCDERFLELALFEQGKAIFFEDDVMGYLALRCTVSGGFNVYNVPIRRRAYAVNGYHKQLEEKDSVIIYNNYLIRIYYGGKSVCNQNNGSVFHQCFDSFLNELFGFTIQCGGCFIQNKYRRIFKHCSCNCNSLLFTT